MALSPEAQAIVDELWETDYKKPFSDREAFAALVAAMGKVQKTRYEPPAYVADAVCIEERDLGEGARIFTVTRKEGDGRKTPAGDKHVLYFHGGAFLLNIMENQWPFVISLVNETGCTLHVLEYPLAPTHGCEDTYRAMMAAYRWVLGQCEPRSMVVLGDSAGAHLAIAACQFALRDGLAQPAQIIVLSPWIDFGDELPGKAERDADDPIIGIVSLHEIPAVWCPEIVHDKACPPNLQYGPFEGMAPVYIQVGSTEVLLVDALELERLVTQAGGTVRLEVGEGLWHTYALYPHMPEGAQAVRDIAQCIVDA